MHTLVVYESLFGNTAEVARAVAAGLADRGSVVLVDVAEAPADVSDVDLLVVGGPTHAFGMTRPRTRTDAVSQGAAPEHAGRGIREWLASLPSGPRAGRVATFDTRVEQVRRLPGSAARGAARTLRRHGYLRLAEPKSFYVADTTGPLLEGEVDRARQWGAELADALAHAAPPRG